MSVHDMYICLFLEGFKFNFFFNKNNNNNNNKFKNVIKKISLFDISALF